MDKVFVTDHVSPYVLTAPAHKCSKIATSLRVVRLSLSPSVRDAKENCEKIASSWGREPLISPLRSHAIHFTRCLFPVLLDGLSERGTTRSALNTLILV